MTPRRGKAVSPEVGDSVPLKVLHLEIRISETNAAYNEHCLPIAHLGAAAICSFRKAELVPESELPCFDGDGTFRGFFRALRSALDHDDYDLIHAHTVHVAFLLLMTRLFTRWRLPSAAIYTFHSAFPNYKFRYKLLLLPVFATFHRIVCCGEASRASLPRFYRWLTREPIVAIPNGVDVNRVDRISKRCAAREPDAPFTVISLGRLIKVKNPFVILNSFMDGAGPNSLLLMAGVGDLRGALEHACGAAGIGDRVEFPGLLPRDTVFEALNRSDLLVSTSWHEGIPVAVLEAMACRCPVLLSDISPHREIAQGADFVPLVAPDDVAGFAREIERIRGMSRSERLEMGEKCRALVEGQFNLATMHQRYAAVYQEAVRMSGGMVGPAERHSSLVPSMREGAAERDSPK